ncbi:MAG: hypothetical protein JXX29_17115, partial [Deltaproteobacteria bacterium]|nr:hypothetical protein [Deltaproteobacteria bacterium]
MSLGNNDYTIFAAINGTTKLEQNYVLLEEMTSPPSGGTWKWTVTGLSGTFDFSTTFSFDPDTIGDSAELKWNIGATTWSGSGTITVTIEDSNNSNYSETRDVQVVLRTLQFTSASVFTGQTGTAAWVPSSDTTPYAFTAPANTVGDPFGTPDWRVGIDDSLLLDISDRGSIGVHASNPYTWSSKISGTFTIGVTEGAKPTSFIMNIPIDLLPLEPVVGYTVFANQNGTGELVANNDSSTYTFTAPSNTGSDPFGTPDWRVGIDDSLILDISNRGSIKIHTSNPFTWTNNINGTFALGIQDGSNPVSYIQNVSLKLGLLNPVQGFTVFELQNGSEDLVPYDDTSTYTFSVPANTAGDPFGTPDWRVGIDDTLMLDVSNRGSMKVHASNSFTWTSIVSGTITFEIKDGTKTSSYFNLVPFTLALLNPLTSFTVFAEQTGSEELVPATDTSTYSFSAPANTAGDVFGTPDWRVGIDDTLVLDISNRGSVKVHTSNPFTWSTNISGTFTLAIQNGAGTSSLFTNVPLKLAMLNPIPSLTIFTKQTGSEELVPTGDISTYGFSIPANATGDPFGTPDWRVGIDDALALTVSNRGSVSIALTNAYTWGSTVSGTVTLAVEDGTAATSYFSGLSTQLRQLASGTIRITNPGATSSVAVNDSTGETWNWSSATDTLNLTDLSVAADGTLTASPVSPATEITGGDYGSASATVQLMSGGTPAAPACTVPFDVSVDIDIQPVGGSVLPHGRQKMLYQASLDVDCEIESGHTITAAFEGAASNVTDNLELVAHDTIANRWVLQSKVDVGTGDLIYLPTTLPASISVPIKVVKSDGTDVVAQSNTIA